MTEDHIIFLDNDDIFYEKVMNLFDIYPYLIEFIKNIKLKSDSFFIGFLSRDAYFCYLLFKKMYPELKEDIDYGYVMSSRKCFRNTENRNYVEYIQKLKDKKGKLLLVDINGTGKSFIKFLEFSKLKNITILFFFKSGNFNNSEKKYSFLVDGFINKFMEVNPHWSWGFNLEGFSRSYHKKIIDLDREYKPIYLDDEKDPYDKKNDKYQFKFVEVYQKILNFMLIPNIRFLTYYKIFDFNLNSNQSWHYRGLLALDIDDTVTNLSEKKSIKEILSLSRENMIKIIFVTSRQIPFLFGKKYEQKKCCIQKILKDIEFCHTDEFIDVWYNPKCFSKNRINPNYLKYLQINKTLTDYKISKENCIFFDDNRGNINSCSKKGIESYLSSSGINDECLQIFKKKFVIQ